MALLVRKVARRIFIVSNITVVVLFLLACCNSFLNPDKWWFISVLGLAFPFLLFIVTAFFLFWLILRSRWAILSLCVLILGYSNIRALIGFHFRNSFSETKPEGALRILTWNVAWFDEQNLESKKNRESYRQPMLDFIKKQQADVVCFQEYLESATLRKKANNLRDITRLGYPYHYKVQDYGKTDGTQSIGVAIFSKYPILDSVRIRYPGPETMRAAESLIGIDINVQGKRVRIYTTHLQSVLLRKDDYRNLRIIKNADDSMLTASKSILKKLRTGYTFRGVQADMVRNELDDCPYPEVVCGDFNDVPNSFTYFRIKGNRLDAFREKSSGIGRTFSHLSPTLRIDYVLADEQYEVLQYKRYVLPYSDHFPLVADLKLKSSE
ncbi:MAG: endonuclease/exonuclease/phosphatase family protein [Chitinophagaceae bacterium]